MGVKLMKISAVSGQVFRLAGFLGGKSTQIRRKCQWCLSVNKTMFRFYENNQKEFMVALSFTEKNLMFKQKIASKQGRGARVKKL